MKVLLPLAIGFEEVEAITIIDVLRRAGLALTTASLTDDQRVEGAHHVVVQADALLKDLSPDDFDAIVLPGGGLGTENLIKDARIIETIRNYEAKNKYICAICAAPTVLAKAGVLKGLKATCYPTCAEVLGESYAATPVIADNNIITSQGPGTAMLFSLVLVHHFVGEEAARVVAKALLSSY